ncbi:zinc finger protein 70-like [Kryptolebias marmoratus]|uniref:C2H2-type domain-containing protein n=1 Tax=Kryptolebias marmoratus TaxID=37003 RepID=A0A3Q2ZCW8_KRYMA|nr:zinc finger protein 70-like [Kryptolebias marmoratus]
MVTVQLLRMSVHERIKAAVNDLLHRLGTGEKSAEAPVLRSLLTMRLTAAAEEIVDLFKKTVVDYEVRVLRAEKEIFRQRRQLDALLQPEVRLLRTESSGEVLLKRRPSLYQGDQQDPESPHIKEEQVELFTYKKGEHLQDIQDNEITNVAFVPAPVKSEDDEEKPQSSQFHCSQTEENRDLVGEPKPATTSDPFSLLQTSIEDSFPDSSDQSDSNWAQTNETQPGDEVIKNSETLESDTGYPVEGQPFPCSYCGKRFSLKGNLNRHIREHTGERPFPCPCCDKSFKDSGSLTAHMRCHTGEQPHSCLFCRKSFSGRGNLTRHMRIHTGEKPYTCLICNKSFNVKEHLNRHKNNHTGEKPFSCSVCGKACGQKTDLKRHMRVHTGEKPFSCSFCGKCCAEKGDLNKHMRVHTGEKPFTCDICGKSCAQKGSLKVHMRVHTGEKPYMCFVCGKGFIITGHLKRHMKLHTAQSQFTDCTNSTKTQSESKTNNPANAS